MNVQSWNNLAIDFAFFLMGVLGIIFKWAPVLVCLIFLILGLLGLIVIGMPIWKAIYQWIKPRPKH
jgi:hypothetical protein